MGKLETPAWIKEGYDSPAEYKKAMQKNKSSTSSKQYDNSPTKGPNKTSSKKSEKTFKIRECPKCESDNVGVVVGEEKSGIWECRKCKWKGVNIIQKELNEDELMAYMDSKGEEVA